MLAVLTGGKGKPVWKHTDQWMAGRSRSTGC